MKKVGILFAIVFLFFIGKSSASSEPVYKHHLKRIVLLSPDKQDSVIRYSETGLVPIIFKIDKHKLIHTPQLDSVANLVEMVLKDKNVGFQYIWIGGSASPEGPVKHNYDLGRWRSEILYKFILDNTSVDSSKVRVENLAEDWEGFKRSLQKELDYPNRDKLLSIIENTEDWATRKKKIISIDNGKTWHNLIYGLFTPYRNARLVIVCTAKPIIKALPNIGFTNLPVPSSPQLINYKPKSIPQEKSTRFLALKNNLILDCALAANIGFEAELWKKTSLDIPFVYSPYDIRVPDRKIRLLGIQPEFRYWLGKKAGEGHFVGMHGALLGFNIALNDRGRFQDPNYALWNAGIGYGFSWNFGASKRWAIEANIGVGYAEYKYDSYRNWNNGARYESNMADNYWGITRAGITIMYKWYLPRKSNK